MIEVKNITKIYPNGKKAVSDVSFKVEKGEICVLIGPSGCGKSTILNMINNLFNITEGEIFVNGKNTMDEVPTELRRNIGYAIQDVSLFPHMSVEENISVVPTLKKWSKEDKAARVTELLELTGLDPEYFRDKFPIQLSGGEQQRVGVARCLGADPPILLMDEPFGAIDPITRTKIQDEFLEIQEKIQKTIVFVTHDMDEAIKMGDKIAILNEGELVQFGTPADILAEPANEFVEDFMGTDRNMKWMKLQKVSEVIEVVDFYCKENDDIEKARKLMEKYKLKSVPVVDDDMKVLGFVTLQRMLNKKGKISDFKIRKYEEHMERKNTLFELMMAMFTGIHNYMIVTNKFSKYLGIVTKSQLDEYLNEL